MRDPALVLAAAEGAGVARWCLDTASEYAKVRVQFGRPIGQFQAIKHALADMLVGVEQTAAVAWDAAAAWSGPEGADERALSARVAGALSLEAAAHCAKKCVQILGGIGFTWEHDAHFYLKRAMATRLLLVDPGSLEHSVATMALDGARRGLSAELPPEAEDRRAALRPLVHEVAATEGEAQRAALVETGLLMPHWPAPWGRGSDPLDQLVIDEELAAAGVGRPHLAVGAWALPTIIAHGTDEQQERWVRPTLLGQLGVVPALQRARGRIGPGRVEHEGRPESRAAGSSTARRSGRRWPRPPTSGSAWPEPTPTRPSTPGSPTSSSTCTPRASTSGPCAS